MPVSMSLAVAKPDSSIRIDESRYGISSALTMKPARSWARITCLPSTSDANADAFSVVPLLVTSDDTSSTTGSTAPGLKNCSTNTSHWPRGALDTLMHDLVDVYGARVAPGTPP